MIQRTITRMGLEYRFNRVPYTGDSYGYVSNLDILDVKCDHTISGLKKLINVIRFHIGDNSHPDHPNSPHDCSGLPFGSNWERVFWTQDEYGYKVILHHSWAIDI